ncbi:MAG: hypothetical protein GC181_10420 [Bacteroidetes bacterium]|nr:hypothetical protein [Bacteroidota bacterium]
MIYSGITNSQSRLYASFNFQYEFYRQPCSTVYHKKFGQTQYRGVGGSYSHIANQHTAGIKGFINPFNIEARTGFHQVNVPYVFVETQYHFKSANESPGIWTNDFGLGLNSVLLEDLRFPIKLFGQIGYRKFPNRSGQNNAIIFEIKAGIGFNPKAKRPRGYCTKRVI